MEFKPEVCPAGILNARLKSILILTRESGSQLDWSQAPSLLLLIWTRGNGSIMTRRQETKLASKTSNGRFLGIEMDKPFATVPVLITSTVSPQRYLYIRSIRTSDANSSLQNLF